MRDNCQSEDCFHPNIKARLITLKDVDTEEIPERVKVNDTKTKNRSRLSYIKIKKEIRKIENQLVINLQEEFLLD